MSQPGTDLAVTNGKLPEGYSTGLEDFGPEDLRMPRLNVQHAEGVIKDSLSEQTFTAIDFIALALIKGRVLWKPTVDPKDPQPLCKSTNHLIGYPTTWMPSAADNFPWPAAQVNPNDFPKDDEGRITLPCTSCRLKDWGSHPVDGKKTWCSEQFVVPMMYGPIDEEPNMTALFTFQRSSLQAAKGYFANMARQQKPAFALKARMTLREEKYGQNKYQVPVIKVLGSVPEDEWMGYSEASATIAEFLRRPPRRKQEDAPDPNTVAQQNQFANNGSWTQQGSAAPVMQQPVQPVQYVQPVQQPVQAQPVQQPVQVVQQPDPWATTAAPSPAPTAPSGGRDAADDLPF